MNNRIANTAEVRAVDKDQRTVDVIASTPAKDSYGTKIDQSGWMLEDFRRNPVITWAHDDRGFTASGGRPIAKALPETIRVEDSKLKMRLKFPDKGKFRFADEVYDLLADGFLNAVSVGFEPIESETVTKEADVIDGEVEEDFIYRKMKLLEVAVVTIPSNSEALVERAKELNADAKEVRIRAEFVEKMAEEVEAEAKEEAEEPKEVPEEPEEEPKEEVKEEVKEETPETPEDERKYKDYFEQKQPVNKVSSEVLKNFYTRLLKEKPPEDEVEAWERIGKEVEAMGDAIDVIEAGAIPVSEETPTEPEPKVKTEEAPQPEQKASVQIPLSALAQLSESLRETCAEAAVTASRKGVPIKDLGKVIDATGETFLSTIFSNQSK